MVNTIFRRRRQWVSGWRSPWRQSRRARRTPICQSSCPSPASCRSRAAASANGAVMAAQKAPRASRLSSGLRHRHLRFGRRHSSRQGAQRQAGARASASVFARRPSRWCRCPLTTRAAAHHLRAVEAHRERQTNMCSGPAQRSRDQGRARALCGRHAQGQEDRLIGDTTAYGQGGYNSFRKFFEKLGAKPSSPNPSSPTQGHELHNRQIKDAGADALVIHGVDQRWPCS